MNAQQLKNSILQMAVQGKLVPQDPNDEPASVLLDRIRKEKEQLIKEGKIKKEKNPSYIFRGADNTPYEKIGNNAAVSIADEVPFDIPDSWEWCRGINCAVIVVGATPSTSNLSFWNNGTIPWLPSGCCQDCLVTESSPIIKYITEAAYNSCSTQLMPVNTVMIALTGATAGKVGLLKFEACGNQSVVGISLLGDMLPEFMFYQLMARRNEILADCVGSAQPHISKEYITKMYMCIPPLAEQKKIVDKLDTLMSLVDQYDMKYEALELFSNSFPDQLKKSILMMAVQGKLVPQDPNDEPASVLLEKIHAEKERLIRKGKIKRDKSESIIYRRDNSHYEKQGNIERCIDDELHFDIPESWEWIRLNDIGIYKKGPFGSSLTKSMFVPKGQNTVKVYEQKNAIQKDHTLGDYYITNRYFDEKMRGFTVSPGDIIVSCAGTIGETYVIPDNAEIGIINQALMKMTIYSPINIDYFLMYFDYVLKQSAREYSKGSAIKNIPPFEILKKLLIPLPPLKEQERIIKKINELNAVCENL